MFNPRLFENSRPDGFPILEIVSGDTGVAPGFVPLKRSRLGGEIAGPLADLILTQTFGYTREQSPLTLEAVYRFPLPGDAAVTGVQVRFGDVEIVAELKAREQAESDYKEAVQQGRQAALATRESPDVFTLRVAGLQPDQDVTVATRFVQLARPDGLNWTLRVPLTTAPRYVRGDEADSRHAQGQPLALLRDPGHRFSLDVRFADCGEVSSATHPLDVEEITETADKSGNGKRARLRAGDVLPDRDLVLSWRVAQEEARPGLSVLLHDDVTGGYTYFLALVAPPRAHAANAGVPRESVLLVDHSGSMSGAKWEASDWAVKQFLGGLTAQDAFALGLFHDKTNWFQHGGLSRESPHAATPESVERAVRFLEGSKDSGGTNLGVALEQALKLRHTSGDASRHVLLVTDAEVTDSGRILRLVDAEAAKPDRRRVSVLCIDAAPNAFLANELAERGGGIARFLTSAPDEEDITTALDSILENFAQPVLANIRLNINRPGAQASGRSVAAGHDAQSSSIDLGDLPRGRAVWVAGRVKREADFVLQFAVSASGREVAHKQADTTQTPSSRPALKALFGARRVLALEYLLTAHYDPDALADQLTRLGYDPKTVLQSEPQNTVYAENAKQADKNPQNALKSLLIKEALEYGLASAETAFVARRMEAGKLIEASTTVANALPSGWSDEFAGGGAPMMAMMAMSAPAMPAPMSAMPAAFDFSTASAPPDASAAAPSGPPVGLRRMRFLAEAASMKRGFTPTSGATTGSSQKTTPIGKSAQSGQAVFAGVPVFASGEVVLFDTSRPEDAAKLPASALLNKLQVRFPNGSPAPNLLSRELMLILYVEDMTMPRARVSLADLMRQGGARPLNVQIGAEKMVKIALSFGAASALSLPALEVALYW